MLFSRTLYYCLSAFIICDERAFFFTARAAFFFCRPLFPYILCALPFPSDIRAVMYFTPLFFTLLYTMTLYDISPPLPFFFPSFFICFYDDACCARLSDAHILLYILLLYIFYAYFSFFRGVTYYFYQETYILRAAFELLLLLLGQAMSAMPQQPYSRFVAFPPAFCYYYFHILLYHYYPPCHAARHYKTMRRRPY